MQELTGNLWDYHNPNHIIAITTNGFVKRNGECVMGRGCALEARQRIPNIARQLGKLITEKGNHVHYLGQGVVSFPVKHAWFQDADIALIERSARELLNMANSFGWKSVIIPRPGCGNGRLQWNDVRSVLDRILDDRFKIIDFARKVAHVQ